MKMTYYGDREDYWINNFDFVQDSLMVDFYTYQIKAYEAKFEYLIKRAKAMGICYK